MANILIVEDEVMINNLIKLNLELAGHACTQIYNGQDALSIAISGNFDLIILDVMLPGLSGFDLIDKIKESEIKTPVIFVTAKYELDDRLRGLRLGAEDYIIKPFEILELVARVDVVLRRTNSSLNNIFEFDDIKINFDSKRVYKNDVEVTLKPKEYALLEVLVNNRNFAMTREKLLEIAWEFDYAGDTRTIDVHIQKIRKKLGLEQRLKTIYKTGYRLEI